MFPTQRRMLNLWHWVVMPGTAVGVLMGPEVCQMGSGESKAERGTGSVPAVADRMRFAMAAA